ncbi:hypothetical protein X777_06574, partial [Ooceraea biroi]
VKEHYTSNKTRNAQVREDVPRAKVEQELEALRYQSYVQQQEERDALVARQIALSLEREERQRERELQELMRLQLRLGDEAMQQEVEKRAQEERDEKQQEEEDNVDGAEDEQMMLDQKLAMEAQDAELARMLQDKERAKARKARERARQRKLERERLQQQQQQEQNVAERPQRPDRLDLRTPPVKNRARHPANYPSQYPDPEEIQTLDEPVDNVREMANVAAIIDPTYNAHRNTSSSSSSTISPTYALPTPPQELMADDAPCYMPIQGQRRTNQAQSPSNTHEEKHKRRVKDGCKHQ